MSQITYDELLKEVENLRNQIKTISAGSDATKQMFNESTNANLQLRTNLLLIHQLNKEANEKVEDLKKQLESLKPESNVVPAKRSANNASDKVG